MTAQMAWSTFSRGGAKQKGDASDVHFPQPQKKLATYFILFLFLFLINFFIVFLGVS
jgi:hypothetical protein